MTLLFQYLLFPQTQSITVVVNGQEYYVTEDNYRTILDANEHFQSISEDFRTEIATLQDEKNKLQQEIDELRQANDTMNNGTGNSGTGSSGSENNGTGNGDSGNNDIKGTVRLRNNENINGCPQVNIPEESQIMGQTTYTMTWNSFEGATTYCISMWKDANYGTAESDITYVNEIEVSGLSYTIDLTALEPGYTYGFNVVVDNHFSSPLLIEIY